MKEDFKVLTYREDVSIKTLQTKTTKTSGEIVRQSKKSSPLLPTWKTAQKGVTGNSCGLHFIRKLYRVQTIGDTCHERHCDKKTPYYQSEKLQIMY